MCPDGIWTPMLHDKLDDPGAALSFSGRLLQPEEVVAVVGNVLDKPRPVTMLPAWRGIQARIADLCQTWDCVPLPSSRGPGGRRKSGSPSA